MVKNGSSTMLPSSSNTSISCIICGKTYDSDESMQFHVRTHFDSQLDCPFCSYSSSCENLLQTHVFTVHAEQLKTPTKTADQVSSNVSFASSSKDGSCPVCNENVLTDQLDDHTQRHLLCDDTAVDLTEENYFSNDDIKRTKSAAASISLVNNDASSSHSNGCLYSIDMDREFAKQLEKEEIKLMHEEKLSRQKAEELEQNFLQEKYHLTSKGSFLSQSFRVMEKEVGRRNLSTAEYFDKKFSMLESLEAGADDQSTCTPCFSDALSVKLQEFSNPGIQCVLSPSVSHFGRGYGDTGWGCGYRNIQMMLSSLFMLPQYKHHLAKYVGNVPSIPKLQQMIEDAWKCGFDPRGCEQLSGKLVKTRKWIGATEAFTLLSSLRLNCKIIDFHRFSNPAKKSHDFLFDWVAKYYGLNMSINSNRSESVIKSNVPVLYLQHEGHSRTIVGLRYRRDQPKTVSHLIVFDPSHEKHQIKKNISNAERWKSTSMFLKTLNSFNKPQYQIVAVDGLASDERYEIQKKIDNLSERIP